MANLSSIEKGDKVILRLFTGAFVEAKEVEKADKTTISFTNKKGVMMKFSKKTGKQIEPEPKSERFASFLDDYDEEVEKAETEKRKRKNTDKIKKSSTKKKPVTDDDDDEYEEVED